MLHLSLSKEVSGQLIYRFPVFVGKTFLQRSKSEPPVLASNISKCLRQNGKSKQESHVKKSNRKILIEEIFIYSKIQ